MAAGKKIHANVIVDGRFYEAGSTVPAEVADKITNPAVWEATSSDDSAGQAEEPATTSEEMASSGGSSRRGSRRSS